jgi:hypothetical protein
MLELGSRERTQPAPQAVVWASLVAVGRDQPGEDGARPWFDLLDDEVRPKIVTAREPDLVEWSSLWPDRPHDRIRFDIRQDGAGSAVRWTLSTTDAAPTESKLGHQRHRLNLLINERLRLSYGQ